MHPVGQVEGFGPELEACLLRDGEFLEEGEIEITRSVPADIGQRSSRIAESERSRLGEYAGVEVSVEARPDGRIERGAAAVVIGP